MESMDNNQPDSPKWDHEDEHMIMDHVVQEEPDLMYLHVCLSEILCKHSDDGA